MYSQFDVEISLKDISPVLMVCWCYTQDHCTNGDISILVGDEFWDVILKMSFHNDRTSYTHW